MRSSTRVIAAVGVAWLMSALLGVDLAAADEVLFSAAALAPPPAPISGVTATASSEFTNDGRFASNLVGGFDFTTGLSAGTNPSPISGLNIPIHTNSNQDRWLSAANGAPGTVEFDLGGVYPLDQMWIWNYSEGTGVRGASSVTISTSLDGNTFTPLPGGNVFALSQVSGGGDTIDAVPLGGVEAQYVLFENLIDINDPNNFVGLDEVIFFEQFPPPLTPEPSSLVLGLVVLAGGGIWFRRKRASILRV